MGKERVAVVGISELATPEGRSARIGSDLGRLRTIGQAAVACRGGRFVFVGTERDFRQGVALAPGGRTLVTAGGDGLIKIWDLESKVIVDELKPEFANLGKGKHSQVPYCTCLCWSFDGSTLYSGYTDGGIRAWHIGSI